MCSRPAFLPIPTTVAPIPTTAAPIPTAADISGRSNPGQRRRLPASRPRSKTAEEDGCADRWPLVEHFPDVQSFSGSEVFLLKQGGGGDDDSFEEETYEGEAAARPSCWNQCCSSR
ncbi:hypothetical protein LINPERHAP1_LOCUS30179 [Linum perenne]